MLCGCSVSFHLRHWKLPDSNQLLLLKFLIYLSLTLDSSAIREGVEGDLPSQTTARSPEQPGQVSAVLSPSLEVLGEPTWYWICSFCLMSFQTTWVFLSLLWVGKLAGGFLLWCRRGRVGVRSQFTHPIVSESLRPHGLQHSRPLCPSPTPGVYSNSCPLSQWCHPTISSSVIPFSSNLQSFPVSQFFASGGQMYWSFSFSISPSSEHSALISFRMDWLDLLAVQGTQFKSLNSSVLSFLYIPTLTSIHDSWKTYTFYQTDLCWQSNVSAF